MAAGGGVGAARLVAAVRLHTCASQLGVSGNPAIPTNRRRGRLTGVGALVPREVVLAGGAVVAARVAAAQEGHLRAQGALNVAGRRAIACVEQGEGQLQLACFLACC